MDNNSKHGQGAESGHNQGMQGAAGQGGMEGSSAQGQQGGMQPGAQGMGQAQNMGMGQTPGIEIPDQGNNGQTPNAQQPSPEAMYHAYQAAQQPYYPYPPQGMPYPPPQYAYAPPPPMYGYQQGMGQGQGQMHGQQAHAAQSPGVNQIMEEIAGGGTGLSSLTRMLNFDDKDFWKGALVGAAAVLLLTNESVQRTLFRGAVKTRDAAEDGVEKVKEGVEKVKKTVRKATSQEQSDE